MNEDVCPECRVDFSKLKPFISSLLNEVIDESGILFEQWQGDGYLDRAEDIKQKLKDRYL